MNKFFKRIFVVICAFIFLSISSAFATDMNTLQKEGKILLVGDSYAGFFTKHYPDAFAFRAFPVSGIDKVDNEYILSEVAANNSYEYYIFSTGVNDHYRQTDVNVFETILENFAKEIALKNKYLFVHTYMSYPIEDEFTGFYKVSDYDAAVKRVADKYQNVIYIDMNEYNDSRYCISDQLHYNKEFYDALYEKIKNGIEYIELVNSLIVDNGPKPILIPGSVKSTD
ncbi:MAG: hypothetical protein J6O09_02230 [Lachnospiraceae bacterium]|nr:hypothetical protein [Lachnospiraceae bacterium]